MKTIKLSSRKKLELGQYNKRWGSCKIMEFARVMTNRHI